MKQIGETKNFYIYAITGDEEYIIDEIVPSDVDEELKYYLDATKSAEGKKALYNHWMYDNYAKDKLEAKNDEWLEEQLKAASRPLYLAVVKPKSTILAYDRAYFVPMPIGDVEPMIFDTFCEMYQVDRYDMSQEIFGADYNAVWRAIDRCVDGGSIDLDAGPEKLVSSPGDEARAYGIIFDDDPYTYDLIYTVEGEDGPEEVNASFCQFNNGLAVYDAATGTYDGDDVEHDHTIDYLIEFFDGVDDFTLDSCKELASRTFPDRDIDEGVPLYLKNRTTGEVLYDAKMSESRERSK